MAAGSEPEGRSLLREEKEEGEGRKEEGTSSRKKRLLFDFVSVCFGFGLFCFHFGFTAWFLVFGLFLAHLSSPLLSLFFHHIISDVCFGWGLDLPVIGRTCMPAGSHLHWPGSPCLELEADLTDLEEA